MRAALTILPIALALAACDGRGDGTAVSVTSANGSGRIDDAGEVKIDAPGFRGTFDMPKMNLTAENFDIDGVHLYPGTKIAAMNVDAGEGRGDGKVTVRFQSPADLPTVRGWLAQQFAKAGTEVAVAGDKLVGRSDDEDFTIALSAAGARTNGVVTIGD